MEGTKQAPSEGGSCHLGSREHGDPAGWAVSPAFQDPGPRTQPDPRPADTHGSWWDVGLGSLEARGTTTDNREMLWLWVMVWLGRGRGQSTGPPPPPPAAAPN